MANDSFDLAESIEHDPATETYRCSFDEASIAPSIAVIEMLAHIRDSDPLELATLYRYVDPEALDALYVKAANGFREGEVVVAFTYDGQSIRVKSGGVIEISSGTDTDEETADRPAPIVEQGKTYTHSDYGSVEVSGIWQEINRVDSARNTDETDAIMVRYSARSDGGRIDEFTDTLSQFLTAVECE